MNRALVDMADSSGPINTDGLGFKYVECSSGLKKNRKKRSNRNLICNSSGDQVCLISLSKIIADKLITLCFVSLKITLEVNTKILKIS